MVASSLPPQPTPMPQQDQQPSGSQDARPTFHVGESSRRSACDRCRDHKLRCERAASDGSGQFSQCRRCSKSQLRCTTTFEARAEHASTKDTRTRGSGNSRKRGRDSVTSGQSGDGRDATSIPGSSVFSINELHSSAQPDRSQCIHPVDSLGNSSHDMSAPYRGDGSLFANASLDLSTFGYLPETNGTTANESAPLDTGDDIFDINLPSFVSWDIFDATTSLPTSGSAGAPDTDNGAYRGTTSSAFMTQLAESRSDDMHAQVFDPKVYDVPQTPNEETASVPTSIADRSASGTRSMDTLLDQLMLLTVNSTKDSRSIVKPLGPDSRLKETLTKTLHNSETFVSVLQELVEMTSQLDSRSSNFDSSPHQSLERTNRQIDEGSQSEELGVIGGNTFKPPAKLHVQGAMIDGQTALQLASCHLAIMKNYEAISTVMQEVVSPPSGVARAGFPDLPGFHIDGFSTLSSSLQAKLFMQVCEHLISEMQRLLEQIRQSGLLSSWSSNVFDTISGPVCGQQGSACAQAIVAKIKIFAQKLEVIHS